MDVTDLTVAQNASLVRRILQLGITLMSCTLLWIVFEICSFVGNTCVVVIFSILFAYAIAPAVRRLTARRVPIGLAVALVYGTLFIAFLGALAWLMPTLVAQAGELASAYPRILSELQHQIANPTSSPLISHFPASLRSTIATNTGKAGIVLGGFVSSLGAGSLTFLSSTTAALINATLVLGLTSMIIAERDDIQAFTIRLVPVRHRQVARDIALEIDEVVGGFVRGQILLALAVTLIASMILLIMQVPYAILLGILTGIINIIPIVGAFIVLVPVALIALITVGWIKAAVIAVAFLVMFQIQQQVLNPLWISRSVGVTPLVFFLALLFGSEAKGILGALLAMPLVGMARVAVDRVFPEAIPPNQTAT